MGILAVYYLSGPAIICNRFCASNVSRNVGKGSSILSCDKRETESKIVKRDQKKDIRHEFHNRMRYLEAFASGLAHRSKWRRKCIQPFQIVWARVGVKKLRQPLSSFRRICLTIFKHNDIKLDGESSSQLSL